MANKSREDWERIIEEQKRSGQSIKSYCEEKGLSPTYFSTRKNQFKNDCTEKTSNAFITLKPCNVETNDSRLKLNIANSQLHFAALPPIHWLSQLLKTV